jgi:hypothetical protein
MQEKIERPSAGQRSQDTALGLHLHLHSNLYSNPHTHE